MRPRSLPLVLATVLAGCIAAGQLDAQSADSIAASKLILDYDVPESPAFSAMGLTPSKVLRASSAKPVVASLLNQIKSGGTIASGIALDFSPYMLYGGGTTGFGKFNGPSGRWRRLAANTLLSLATVQADDDTASLRYGIGVRTTLVDGRSMLEKSILADLISRRLAERAQAPTTLDDDAAPVRVTIDFSDIYELARDSVRKIDAFALSIGLGSAGLARGAVADRDSLSTSINRMWISGSYGFAGGHDVLVTGQWQNGPDIDRSMRIGAALRVNTSLLTFSGEMAYDSDAEAWQPGAIAEIRLVSRLHVTVSLGSDTDAGTPSVSRLRVRSAVRWNMSEMP